MSAIILVVPRTSRGLWDGAHLLSGPLDRMKDRIDLQALQYTALDLLQQLQCDRYVPYNLTTGLEHRGSMDSLTEPLCRCFTKAE